MGITKLGAKLKIGILVVLLFAVGGIQYLYLKDSKSLESLRGVLSELQAKCALAGRYPNKEEFKTILSHHNLENPNEWLLFTSMDLKKGSLQYPMNLPILWAPGQAKISEFLPVIYAFVIKDPCLFKEVSRDQSP